MSETTEEVSTSPESAPKKSNRTSIIIAAILGIVVIVQGIKIYLDHQENVALVSQNESTDEELAKTYQKLKGIQGELDLKIEEIAKLGGNVEELEKAKAEVEKELTRTRRATRNNIAQLKDQVSGYEQLLKAKDEEIKKLTEINTELLSENTNLKTEKNELTESISELTQTREELATKVAIASQLRAEGINIIGINSRGKEREGPFKKRHIDKLKVVFNIAENDVAPIEGKNILIKITDGNGQVIFDVSKGSGTFMFNNKEEFYTANQEILFDNSKQQLTFEYQKGSEYESGIYTMDIFTDGYRMGSTQFEVK